MLSDLIRQLRKNGGTVIIVTHDMDFIAGLADRLILLHRGEILAEGTVSDVYNCPEILDLTRLQSPLLHRIIVKLVQEGTLPKESMQICTVDQLGGRN